MDGQVITGPFWGTVLISTFLSHGGEMGLRGPGAQGCPGETWLLGCQAALGVTV